MSLWLERIHRAVRPKYHEEEAVNQQRMDCLIILEARVLKPSPQEGHSPHEENRREASLLFLVTQMSICGCVTPVSAPI